MSNKKQLLFSVTKNDCEWSYTRGTGSGGQKKNKTSSAVHCSHPPSGARSYCEESRSQGDNKRSAFLKMVETPEFKKWHMLEVMRQTGKMAEIDRCVETELNKIKVEVKEDGKWVEVDKHAPMPT